MSQCVSLHAWHCPTVSGSVVSYCLAKQKIGINLKIQSNVSLCVNDFIFHSLSSQGSKRGKKRNLEVLQFVRQLLLTYIFRITVHAICLRSFYMVILLVVALLHTFTHLHKYCNGFCLNVALTGYHSLLIIGS